MKMINVKMDEGNMLLNAELLHFKQNVKNGSISAHSSLTHSGVDICRIPLGIFTAEGKRRVLNGLFNAFTSTLYMVDDILVVETQPNGVYFKDKENNILKKFSPNYNNRGCMVDQDAV